MMGLRWAMLYRNQPREVQDGTYDWIWPAAEKAGVPVSLHGRRVPEKFRWIAETHPQLTLMIDHCGLKVLTKDVDAIEHIDELLTLAKLPNVAIKATAAPAYSSQPYPFRNLHDPLHRIFDAFGPDRFFWGTDITRMTCTYRQCVTFFTEELPWLKGHDLEKVMGRALANGSAGNSLSDAIDTGSEFAGATAATRRGATFPWNWAKRDRPRSLTVIHIHPARVSGSRTLLFSASRRRQS